MTLTPVRILEQYYLRDKTAWDSPTELLHNRTKKDIERQDSIQNQGNRLLLRDLILIDHEENSRSQNDLVNFKAHFHGWIGNFHIQPFLIN